MLSDMSSADDSTAGNDLLDAGVSADCVPSIQDTDIVQVNRLLYLPARRQQQQQPQVSVQAF